MPSAVLELNAERRSLERLHQHVGQLLELWQNPKMTDSNKVHCVQLLCTKCEDVLNPRGLFEPPGEEKEKAGALQIKHLEQMQATVKVLSQAPRNKKSVVHFLQSLESFREPLQEPEEINETRKTRITMTKVTRVKTREIKKTETQIVTTEPRMTYSWRSNKIPRHDHEEEKRKISRHNHEEEDKPVGPKEAKEAKESREPSGERRQKESKSRKSRERETREPREKETREKRERCPREARQQRRSRSRSPRSESFRTQSIPKTRKPRREPRSCSPPPLPLLLPEVPKAQNLENQNLQNLHTPQLLLPQFVSLSCQRPSQASSLVRPLELPNLFPSEPAEFTEVEKKEEESPPTSHMREPTECQSFPCFSPPAKCTFLDCHVRCLPQLRAVRMLSVEERLNKFQDFAAAHRESVEILSEERPAAGTCHALIRNGLAETIIGRTTGWNVCGRCGYAESALDVHITQCVHCPGSLLVPEREEGWAKCTACGLVLRKDKQQEHFRKKHASEEHASTTPRSRAMCWTLEEFHGEAPRRQECEVTQSQADLLRDLRAEKLSGADDLVVGVYMRNDFTCVPPESVIVERGMHLLVAPKSRFYFWEKKEETDTKEPASLCVCRNFVTRWMLLDDPSDSLGSIDMTGEAGFWVLDATPASQSGQWWCMRKGSECARQREVLASVDAEQLLQTLLQTMSQEAEGPEVTKVTEVTEVTEVKKIEVTEVAKVEVTGVAEKKEGEKLLELRRMGGTRMVVPASRTRPYPTQEQGQICVICNQKFELWFEKITSLETFGIDIVFLQPQGLCHLACFGK